MPAPQPTNDELRALLDQAVTVVRHYRRREHRPTDVGWMEVASWVADDAVRMADKVLAEAKVLGVDGERPWWL
jgi:hypothetical protein